MSKCMGLFLGVLIGFCSFFKKRRSYSQGFLDSKSEKGRSRDGKGEQVTNPRMEKGRRWWVSGMDLEEEAKPRQVLVMGTVKALSHETGTASWPCQVAGGWRFQKQHCPSENDASAIFAGRSLRYSFFEDLPQGPPRDEEIFKRRSGIEY